MVMLIVSVVWLAMTIIFIARAIDFSIALHRYGEDSLPSPDNFTLSQKCWAFMLEHFDLRHIGQEARLRNFAKILERMEK